LTIALLKNGEIQYDVQDATNTFLIRDHLGNDAMRWEFAWGENEDLWIYCEEGIFLVHRDGQHAMTRTAITPRDLNAAWQIMPIEFREYLPQAIKRDIKTGRSGSN